jgi:signal transduction histidine kinase
LSGVVRDITAERFVEDRLRDDNQRLTNEVDRQATLAAERGRKVERLTHELLGAEQHKRARIRRLIHDDLQQILVSSRMQAALLRDAAASRDSEPLSRIVQQIDEALECTRDLTLRLATASYEDQGLWAALVELCEQMKRRYGLQVALTSSGELPGMRSEVMQLIYSALRELLFNVVKHAGVDKARVHLTFDAGQQLKVVVEDDGVGFEAATLSWQQRGSGLGLGGMRTRFATIDGTLSVVSSPGGGCRIEVYIPDAAMRDALSG